MGKYKAGNFVQISRRAFRMLEGCKPSVKWLYVILCELEHKFTGQYTDYFFRGIDDLQNDSGLSRETVIGGLRELEKVKLIKKWQAHWKDREGRLSVKHITAIKILEV